jgi:hypothetical protein
MQRCVQEPLLRRQVPQAAAAAAPEHSPAESHGQKRPFEVLSVQKVMAHFLFAFALQEKYLVHRSCGEMQKETAQIGHES